jgi:hypothetical protein
VTVRECTEIDFVETGIAVMVVEVAIGGIAGIEVGVGGVDAGADFGVVGVGIVGVVVGIVGIVGVVGIAVRVGIVGVVGAVVGVVAGVAGVAGVVGVVGAVEIVVEVVAIVAVGAGVGIADKMGIEGVGVAGTEIGMAAVEAGFGNYCE